MLPIVSVSGWLIAEASGLMQSAGTLRKSDAVGIPAGQFQHDHGASGMARRADKKAPNFRHRIAASVSFFFNEKNAQ
jgi:hypothetical protein